MLHHVILLLPDHLALEANFVWLFFTLELNGIHFWFC
jgi:hypothetical protein